MLCAGLQLVVWLALQGGEPRSEGDGVVKCRTEKQKQDRDNLAARQDEINEAFKGWNLGHSSQHLGARTPEGTAVKQICRLAIAQFPDDRTTGICTSWQNDMAELVHRIRPHWAPMERKSLTSFLTRFEDVLKKLLMTPRAESAYHPAARRPAADRKRVVELFVSGAGCASFPEAETDDAAPWAGSTDTLERRTYQKQSGQLTGDCKVSLEAAD